jgi:hydrogenase expression/formation protein HypD
MRFLDEYREYASVQRMAEEIRRVTTKSWTIMEVCGGQTYTIVKSGLQQLLPDKITLVHGPGCPVCVTPTAMIDRAVAIAMLPKVILCSFGDMLRVPGSTQSLLDVKALGAEVRIVYSPLDALQLARSNPDREVVFFAVGFETTAPANAMAVWQAAREGLSNFSMLMFSSRPRWKLSLLRRARVFRHFWPRVMPAWSRATKTTSRSALAIRYPSSSRGLSRSICCRVF